MSLISAIVLSLIVGVCAGLIAYGLGRRRTYDPYIPRGSSGRRRTSLRGMDIHARNGAGNARNRWRA